MAKNFNYKDVKMNCTGQPLTDSMAKTIEGIRLYCDFNKAWIEMYLNTLTWMTPYGWIQACDKYKSDNKTD
jgi:hypothetical protein